MKFVAALTWLLCTLCECSRDLLERANSSLRNLSEPEPIHPPQIWQNDHFTETSARRSSIGSITEILNVLLNVIPPSDEDSSDDENGLNGLNGLDDLIPQIARHLGAEYDIGTLEDALMDGHNGLPPDHYDREEEEDSQAPSGEPIGTRMDAMASTVTSDTASPFTGGNDETDGYESDEEFVDASEVPFDERNDSDDEYVDAIEVSPEAAIHAGQSQQLIQSEQPIQPTRETPQNVSLAHHVHSAHNAHPAHNVHPQEDNREVIGEVPLGRAGRLLADAIMNIPDNSRVQISLETQGDGLENILSRLEEYDDLEVELVLDSDEESSSDEEEVPITFNVKRHVTLSLSNPNDREINVMKGEYNGMEEKEFSPIGDATITSIKEYGHTIWRALIDETCRLVRYYKRENKVLLSMETSRSNLTRRRFFEGISRKWRSITEKEFVRRLDMMKNGQTNDRMSRASEGAASGNSPSGGRNDGQGDPGKHNESLNYGERASDDHVLQPIGHHHHNTLRGSTSALPEAAPSQSDSSSTSTDAESLIEETDYYTSLFHSPDPSIPPLESEDLPTTSSGSTGLTLDIAKPDRTNVIAIRESMEQVISLVYISKPKHVIVSVVENGCPLWTAKEGERCMLANVLSDDKSTFLAMWVDKANNNDFRYYVKNADGSWHEITKDVYNEKSEGIRESLKDLRERNAHTLDLSSPNSSNIDISEESRAGVKWKECKPREGVRVTTILHDGSEVWKAKRGEKCLVANLLSDSKSTLVGIGIDSGVIPEYKYYAKNGTLWTPIKKDEYDGKSKTLREVLQSSKKVRGPVKGAWESFSSSIGAWDAGEPASPTNSENESVGKREATTKSEEPTESLENGQPEDHPDSGEPVEAHEYTSSSTNVKSQIYTLQEYLPCDA